ncbi:hypothetical protein FKP32DRAFT_1378846 [Trametes sanguinea]|nr:hypothetical protein FKP32DRAFT_1378846 [Trametes sanguinea]
MNPVDPVVAALCLFGAAVSVTHRCVPANEDPQRRLVRSILGVNLHRRSALMGNPMERVHTSAPRAISDLPI